MVATINDAYINALLADAAYVSDLDLANTPVKLTTALTGRMTPTLAKYIGDNFTVVTQINGLSSSFESTVWRGNAGTPYAGQVYISMRGTQELADFVADADLASTGLARAQLVDMVNWWLRETLVAEGVETGAQHRELCTYGCDLIQGYYFHRPLEEQLFCETFERERGEQAGESRAPLYFLIYVSRCNRQLKQDELIEMLNTIRQHNRLNGISGCLIHQDGEFMQLLEGKQQVLHALRDRIRADERHEDFRVIAEGPLQQRVFNDWGMVLRHVGDSEGSKQPDFSAWQKRKIPFAELADDPRLCYAYITAHAVQG